MKKKIIILSSALTAILSAGTVFAGGPDIIPIIPDYFTGLFVGPIGGVTQTLWKVNASTSIDQSSIVTANADGTPGVAAFGPGYYATSNGAGTFDGFVGLDGGLGITIAHQYYVGVAGFGEWGKSTSTTFIQSNQNGGFAVADVPAATTASITNQQTAFQQTITTMFKDKYGVYFKPGYLVTPTTLVFGEVGGLWANLKVTDTADYSTRATVTTTDVIPDDVTVTVTNNLSGSGSGSSSSGYKTKTALLLGAGFETFVLPQWFGTHVTVGADYKYANFGHVTTSTPVTGTLSNSTNSAVFSPASTGIAGSTSATAAVKISEFNGFAHVYFGNQWF